MGKEPELDAFDVALAEVFTMSLLEALEEAEPESVKNYLKYKISQILVELNDKKIKNHKSLMDEISKITKNAN